MSDMRDWSPGRIILALSGIVLAAACLTQGLAQPGKFSKIGPNDFPLLLPNSIVLFKASPSGELELGVHVERGQVPAPYGDLSWERGDVLMMLNGQPVVSGRECKEQYAQLPVGEVVKMGLRRGQQVLTVSFPKPDPAELPKLSFRDKSKVENPPR